MARLTVMRLLLALSLAPLTSQASAQTPTEVEAPAELRQTLPARRGEEGAREMRENFKRARGRCGRTSKWTSRRERAMPSFCVASFPFAAPPCPANLA